MANVTRKWRTQHDDRVCPICEHLDGWEFTVEAVNGELPESIIHPVYGEVWNKMMGSLAHEHYQFGKKSGLLSSCRCHVETLQVSSPELLEAVKHLRDTVKEALQEGENPDYQKGSSRKTTFEDLGIDPSKYDFE
jgi:hypothetical protein